MPDPNVREVGQVDDIDGLPLEVGVDYDCVTVGDRRIPLETCEQFAALFIRACWEAADNARLMAEDT